MEGLVYEDPGERTHIGVRGNFPPHMSAESPLNISPNCLELISKNSEISTTKNLKNLNILEDVEDRRTLDNLIKVPSGDHRGSPIFLGGYYHLFWLV